MKPIYRYSLIFATVAAGLTSCSNDELISKENGNDGRTIHLNVTATKGALTDAETRSALTENEVGGLNFAWTKGDRIIVTTENGTVKGTLSLIGEGGKATGEFEGDLTGIQGTNVKFNYYYIGTENNTVDLKDLYPYSHSYAEQKGTSDSMDDYDLMTSSAAMELTGVDSYSLKMEFKRRVSNAKFELRLPKGVEYPITITLSGDELNNKVNLSYDKADASCVSFEKGDIKVVVAEAGENKGEYLKNDIFVTHLPTTAAYELKFKAEDKNKMTYTGSYNISRAVGQNEYFRKKYTEGETETFGGLPVEFTADKQKFTLVYEPNYTPTSDLNKVYTKNRVGSADFTVQTYDLFTRDGYEIVGWNTEADGSGTPYKANDSLIITWPETTATLYAQWEKSVFDYTIIFADRDGNEIAKESFEAGSPYTISVKKYEHIALPGIPANMELEGWALKEAPNTIVTELTYDTEHTVYTVVPVYKEFTWKFQWVDDPTVGEEVYKIKLEKGTTSPHTLGSVHPANPTKDGYKFLGWEYNGKMIASEKEVVATKDNLNPLIYAKWEKNPTTVTTPGYNPGTFN